MWAVFLWLSMYIYLTYSEKSSGFCSSRKSGSGYFVGSTWKFSEIYNFVQISYFLYSCRVAVFWWKITFDDKVIYWYATQCLHAFILEFAWLTEWVWVILRLYKVSTWYQIIRKLLRFWRIKITSNIKQLGNNCYLLLVSNKFSLRN